MKREPKQQRKERDLRRYARTTQIQLIVGGLLILLVVGNGLIRWMYGAAALRMSLLCSFAGLVPVILIVLWLWIVESIVRRERGD